MERLIGIAIGVMILIAASPLILDRFKLLIDFYA